MKKWNPNFCLSGAWPVVLLLATAILGTSCKTYSSRLVSDSAPCVARLKAGGSIREEVDRLALPLIESGEIYGAAIGVLTPDGSTLNYGYGRTGRPGDAQPPGADTIFEVGSISKLFVASLLALLVEEGKLHYEDTVRGILPQDVALSADVGQLTLYELVTHTGGLPRQPNNSTQLRYFIKYLFTGRNLYGYITKPYLYEYLRTCRLKPKGQRQHAYSNIGTALLAHLIEVRTGRSIPDLVEEKICRPLNMHDTVFALDAEQRKRLAIGHVGDQPKFVRRNTPMADWDMGEIMRASGGLYSSVNDLITFAKSNLGLLGHSLDPLLASTHCVQFRTPTEDVAFGWLINYFDEGHSAINYMHGMVSGYSAYIGMDGYKPIAVVVLYNNFNWHDKIGHNLVLRLSGALETGNGSDRSSALKDAH